MENHRKAKGKDTAELTKTDEVNKPVSDEEANEFLKLMKHSEYSVVDQLKKTPARISLLSFVARVRRYGDRPMHQPFMRVWYVYLAWKIW